MYFARRVIYICHKFMIIIISLYCSQSWDTGLLSLRMTGPYTDTDLHGPPRGLSVNLWITPKSSVLFVYVFPHDIFLNLLEQIICVL